MRNLYERGSWERRRDWKERKARQTAECKRELVQKSWLKSGDREGRNGREEVEEKRELGEGESKIGET